MVDLTAKIVADASGVAPGVAQADSQINGLTALFERLRQAALGIGPAAIKGFGEMAAGAKEAAVQVQEAAETVEGMREALVGFGELMLAAFAVNELVEWARKMGEAGEKTEHFSQRLGISVGDVQRLGGMAILVGGNIDQMVMALGRLDLSFAKAKEGSKSQAQAFKEIGINAQDTYTPLELLRATMEGVSKLPDGIQKTAVAMQLLGRSGAALIPFLNLGKDGFDQLIPLVERYGVVNEDAAHKAGILGEAFNENKLASIGLSNVLAQAFAPILNVMVRGVNDLTASIIKSYKEHGIWRTVIDGVAASVKTAVIQFMTFWEVIEQGWIIVKAIWREMQVAWGLVQDTFTTGIAVIEASFRDLAITIADALAGNWVGAAGAAMDGVGKAAAAARTHVAGIKADLADFGKVGAAALNESSARFAQYAANVRKVMAGGGGSPLPEGKGGEGDTSGLPSGTGKEKKAESRVPEWAAQFQALEDLSTGALRNIQKDEEQYWANMLARTDLSKNERIEIERKYYTLKAQLRREAIAEEIAADKTEEQDTVATIETRLAAQKEAIQEQIAAIKQGEADGTVSRAAALSQIEALLAKEVEATKTAALEMYLARDRLDLQIMANYAVDTKEYQAALNDQVRAYTAFQNALTAADTAGEKQRLELERQAEAQRRASLQQTVTGLVNVWATGFQGWVKGTESFRQTWQNFGREILAQATQWAAKKVAIWVTSEILQTQATTVGNLTRMAIEQGSSAQGIALSVTTSLAKIANSAAVAAAGAFEAVANIPIIGPFIAPAIAAGALAAVLALGSKLFSAESGFGEVPASGALTMLHPKEMVLPADIAEPVRNMAAANGPGGIHPANDAAGAGAGAGHVHNWYVSAVDAKSFRDMLRGRQGQEMMREFEARLRGGAAVGRVSR